MQVRVLYFGVLKDAFSCDGEMLELADGATVADLLLGFRGREVGREGFWDSIAVAVNQEYAKAEDLLTDGDEVALLPPVSGGSEEAYQGLKPPDFPLRDDKQEGQQQRQLQRQQQIPTG
jgi:molybdopterin converting factor subunit 1